MQNISTVAGLKDAIKLLQAERDIKGQLLKQQFSITYESFRPINILKNYLKGLLSTPDLVDSITDTTLGAAGGFLFRKLFVGKSGSLLKKISGFILQLAITNLIARKSGLIKTFGHAIIQRFFSRKERLTESI